MTVTHIPATPRVPVRRLIFTSPLGRSTIWLRMEGWKDGDPLPERVVKVESALRAAFNDGGPFSYEPAPEDRALDLGSSHPPIMVRGSAITAVQIETVHVMGNMVVHGA